MSRDDKPPAPAWLSHRAEAGVPGLERRVPEKKKKKDSLRRCTTETGKQVSWVSPSAATATPPSADPAGQGTGSLLLGPKRSLLQLEEKALSTRCLFSKTGTRGAGNPLKGSPEVPTKPTQMSHI